MNTNYTKIHTRFFNYFIWCNQFGKRGYAHAMKYDVAISYTEHSQHKIIVNTPPIAHNNTGKSPIFLSDCCRQSSFISYNIAQSSAVPYSCGGRHV